MKDFRIALAQINPVLGDLSANLKTHLQFIQKAKKAKADFVMFPELSLTGYFLRDLTQEISLAMDSPPVRRLVSLSKGISILFGFVEESADHRFFNTVVFAEDGKILHSHRKVYLPTYEILEEARYFAAGDRFRAFQSKLGRFGIVTCEDLWHLSSSYLLFVQGVDAILCPSNSPGRGISEEGHEVRTARTWTNLLTTQSTFFNIYSIFCNRVGFEDGIFFLGSSKVISPFGRVIATAKGLDPELVTTRLTVSALRRSRMAIPILRDEKPHIVLNELRRHLDENLED